ncbi:autotransporter domain-containing protein [Lutimaribacter saemankumensis]|nr:autotransporter domain-containing protein [Lutimaribacter saemankumensis]
MQALHSCVLAGIVAVPPVAAEEYSFDGLGFLGSTSPYSYPWGVSDDGSTIVGESRNSSSQTEAFRWSAGSGMQGLGFLSGSLSPNSRAFDISGDGSVIVGDSINASGQFEAFRWTAGSGMQALGFLSGSSSFPYSRAFAVSGDGSTIVGESRSGSNLNQAFRWTAGSGMQGLGFLNGSTSPYSRAWGVSNDGSIVVGEGRNSSNTSEAFRWTASSGMQGLGFLNSSGTQFSRAFGISGDGNIIVGDSSNPSNRTEAFRWSSSSGMQGLGFLSTNASYHYSRAWAASNDGSIIVGSATNSSGQTEVFRWTAQAGMLSLSDLLSAEGVNMNGVQLYEARAVSSDGTTITGYMSNTSNQTEAFVAIYDTSAARPVVGVIAPAGYQSSVTEVSQLSLGVAGQGHAGLRQLSDVARTYELPEVQDVVAQGFAGTPEMSYGVFAYGETLWGQDDSAGKARSAAGTAGFIGESSSGLRFGFGIELADLERTEGTLGSFVEADGFGGVAFLAYAPADTGLQASVSAKALKLEADVVRNYTNGAAVETSRGNTDGTYRGIELELGYAFGMSERSTISPFFSYQYSKSKFDGYTETGGSFPGVMSEQSATLRTASVGLAGTYRVSDALKLNGSLALGRTEESVGAPGLSVTGLNGMMFGAATGDRDYGIATLGIGMTYDLSGNARLYTKIDAQKALDSIADDIDAVSVTVGMSYTF